MALLKAISDTASNLVQVKAPVVNPIKISQKVDFEKQLHVRLFGNFIVFDISCKDHSFQLH